MSRTGRQAFVDVLRRALYAAVAAADRAGVTRAQIAAEVDVEARTLDGWKNPSEGAVIPAVSLVMLMRRDVLPQDAKRVLVNELLAHTGLTCVIDDADQEDTGTPLQQLADIAGAMGTLAASLNRAARRDGDGGERMTATEAAIALKACDEVARQTEELRRLLRHEAHA